MLSSLFDILPSGALVWTAKKSQRLVVPPAFRAPLLLQAHDSLTLGHSWVDKTYAHPAEAHYWPSMHCNVHAYVVSCKSCQSNKLRNHLHTCQPSLS